MQNNADQKYIYDMYTKGVKNKVCFEPACSKNDVYSAKKYYYDELDDANFEVELYIESRKNKNFVLDAFPNYY